MIQGGQRSCRTAEAKKTIKSETRERYSEREGERESARERRETRAKCERMERNGEQTSARKRGPKHSNTAQKHRITHKIASAHNYTIQRTQKPHTGRPKNARLGELKISTSPRPSPPILFAMPQQHNTQETLTRCIHGHTPLTIRRQLEKETRKARFVVPSGGRAQTPATRSQLHFE